jgi:hypothetical protein
VSAGQLPAIGYSHGGTAGMREMASPPRRYRNHQPRKLPCVETDLIGVIHFLQQRMKLSTVLFVAALVGLSVAGDLRATTINFEGFPDSTILTTQYPGLTFSNTIILSSGISLNEFEFPPHSGVNVASDNNGPITIDFTMPITSFSGYFTYLEPLTLDGFNASDTEVASAPSEFSDNDALFGDPGSSPNELIELIYAGGMSSVTITGDPLGGSFTMDDVTYGNKVSSVPEPGSFPLVITAAAVLFATCLRRRRL